MRRGLSVIGGMVLAALLSQFPEYAQQYEQRLGGAVDELRIIVNEFELAATNFGLTRDEALARYAATEDEFIRGRGISMARIISRYETLSAALAEISGATGWQRLQHLPEYLDSEIGARALENFEPAVPLTPEGFVYGLAGFTLGYLLLSGLVRFLMLPFRRRRPPRSA
jgi:hypothetical protein